MSQIDLGCIFDGFTMNLRFGIGEKSRGRVEPFFSPVGDRDHMALFLLLLIPDRTLYILALLTQRPNYQSNS